MRRRPLAILLLLFLASLGCGTNVETQKAEGLDLARLAPSASSLGDWRVVDGPTVYAPATLYEYLDGGAPRYLEYGFRKLIHIRYQHGSDSRSCVTLDLFDMGGDTGAFGIYRSAGPDGSPLGESCAEGRRFGAVGSAWKGPVFVHAEIDDERPELTAMLERLVDGICKEAPGQRSRPALLEPLPPGGLVPESERCVPRDLLGHAFLPGGVLAEYVVEGKKVRLFFSDLGSKAAAVDAVARLRRHYTQVGTVTGADVAASTEGFGFSEPEIGQGVIVAAGRFVAGVQGDAAPAAAKTLLAKLVSRLGDSYRGDSYR